MNIKWRKGTGDWWWLFEGYTFTAYSVVKNLDGYVVEFDRAFLNAKRARGGYPYYAKLAIAPTLKEAQDIAEVYMRMGIRPE